MSRPAPSRSRKRAAPLVAALLALAWGGGARANMAATQLRPARFAPPVAARAVGVAVESERLRFVCEERAGAPACRFEAAYQVRNPGAGPEAVVGAFYGARAREVAIDVGGQPVGRELTEAEGRALDEALEAIAREQIRRAEAPIRVGGDAAARFGFEAAFGPGEGKTLTARGTLEPGLRFVPSGYRTSAVEARHLLLGSPSRERIFDLEYLLAPIWTWTGNPTIEVELVVRGPYRVELGEGWTREEHGGKVVARIRWASKDAPASLFVGLVEDPPVLGNGGVLLGVGGAFGKEHGFRARLGYEGALQSWVLFSAAAETDFSRRLQLVPAVEAASPVFLVVPSAGIGLGMPVRLHPEVRLAARAQASVMFYPAGVFAAVDYYPSTGTSPDLVEGTLMFQASF